MMRDIYREAHRVIVWLPEVESTAGGFSEWHAWRDWHRGQLVAGGGQPSPAPHMVYTHPRSNNLTYPVATSNDRRIADLLAAWDHVVKLVGSSWWARTWVYQELMIPSQALFLFDGIYAPWDELARLLRLFADQRMQHSKFCADELRRLSTQSESKTLGLPACCACCIHECRILCGECQSCAQGHSEKEAAWVCSCLQGLCSYCEAGPIDRSKTKSQRKFLQEHKDQRVERSGRSFGLATLMLDQKQRLPSKTPYLPMAELMKHSRNCDATDQIDKVYGFLGLADPSLHSVRIVYADKEKQPVVDRHRETVQFLVSALTETAVAIIQQERQLDLLAVARENGSNPPGPGVMDSRELVAAEVYTDVAARLPSWVPDWTVPDVARTAYREFVESIEYPAFGNRYERTVQVRAAPMTNAVFGFQNRPGLPNGLLRARGARADTLTRAHHNRPLSPFSRFYGAAGTTIQTIPNAQAGDEVWVFLGCNDTFTMRKDSNDGTYRILGLARLIEPATGSINRDWRAIEEREARDRLKLSVNEGGLLEKLKAGVVSAEDVWIA